MNREKVLEHICLMAKYSPLLWEKIDAMPGNDAGDLSMDRNTNEDNAPHWIMPSAMLAATAQGRASKTANAKLLLSTAKKMSAGVHCRSVAVDLVQEIV
eukprot:gene7952-13844_t